MGLFHGLDRASRIVSLGGRDHILVRNKRIDLAAVGRQPLLIQAGGNHLHIDQQRATALKSRHPGAHRIGMKLHQGLKLEVRRGMDHPAHDLPFIRPEIVRTGFLVDDRETAIFDAPPERGHLSHIIHLCTSG